MATDAALTVESSPTDVLKTLTPAQHKTWRATGEIPESKSPPAEKPETKDSKTEAASSPAAKTEVAAPAPAKAAAEEPAKSAPAATEPAKPVHNAETRVKQLLSENKELKAKLDDLQRNAVPAPTKTEKAPVKPSRNDVDEKTGQAKYATDDEFLDARDKYVAEMASHQTRQDIAKEQRERQAAEETRILEQRMQNSIKIAIEKHPDFAEVLKSDTKDGKTVWNADAVKKIKSGGLIDRWILDSDSGMELIYFLAKNPDEVDRIQGLNAFAAARELTKLEDKLATPASAAPAPKAEEKPAGSTTPPKVSSAPAPAASVGGKGTAPTDEAEAALKDGDFKRYQKVENEADFRRKKAS